MKPIAPGGAAIPRATAASAVWPDTFNNYFRPDTAIAATRLLEGLGFQVDIPAAPLCCGRPLYDWGWVDQAKALWRNTLGAMAEDIRSGDPIIGLEPACVSAFRDELPNLFPGDAQAQALSKQTRFLTEFLKDRGLSPAAPDSHAPLLVQFHCHHHSVLDKKAESELIKALPAPSQVLQHGCCGMAGAFGFEVAKYALSRTIAEHGLLPEIANTPRDTIIIANGFSCREQIEQLSRTSDARISRNILRPLGLSAGSWLGLDRSGRRVRSLCFGAGGDGVGRRACRSQRESGRVSGSEL